MLSITGKFFKTGEQETFKMGDKDMKSLTFVITTESDYPKKVAFKTYKNSIISVVKRMRENDVVVVEFIPQSFLTKKGNYINSLKAIKFDVESLTKNDELHTKEVVVDYDDPPF